MDLKNVLQILRVMKRIGEQNEIDVHDKRWPYDC